MTFQPSKLALAAALAFAASAWAGDLVINTDASDPAPKAAFEALVKGLRRPIPTSR